MTVKQVIYNIPGGSMFKKLIVLLTSICVSMSISLVSVAAEGQSKEYPEELVALMKQQIYETFPEKFPERNIVNMTLSEMQERADVHSVSYQDGAVRTQDKTFIRLHENAFWALSADGVIDVKSSTNYSVSFATTFSWDSGIGVQANFTKGNNSSVTHHVEAFAGKVCAPAYFSRVTAREYTTYMYDNYTGYLVGTYYSTIRTVEKTWIEGVYDGQTVYKFYNSPYVV